MKALAGQRILVTGATSGIGLEAVRRFAKLGWHVIATGRKEERLLEIRAELAAWKVDTARLDVDEPDSIAACKAEVLALTGGYGVDVVVNNAGFAVASPILDLDDRSLRAQFATNVFGAIGVSRAFLPAMIERGHGRIINVSSSGGRISLPFVGAYHGAKFAIEALSDAMRWELAPFGIRISVIEPGPVRTPFVDRVLDSTQTLDPNSVYAPAYANFARIQRLAENNMLAPEAVVDDIVHAASARRPRPRYLKPRFLAIVIWLAHAVPTRFLDYVIGRMFGLDRLRRALPNSIASMGDGKAK